MQIIFPNWWRGLFSFFIFFLIGTVCVLLGSIIAKNSDPNLAGSFEYLSFSTLSFFLLRILYRKSELNIMSHLKISEGKIVMIVVTLAVIQSITFMPIAMPKLYYEAIFHNIPPDLTIYTVKRAGLLSLVNSITMSLVLAPIIEEVFFRGFLLEQFLKQYPRYLSIIGVSILFALVHPVQSMGEHLFYSIIVGVIYNYTHSLLLVIIYHSLSNLLVGYIIPMTYRVTEDLFFSPWYMISFIVGTLIIIYLLNKIKRIESKESILDLNESVIAKQ